MRRVVSWKRLSVVVAVCVVLSAASYAVHATQVRRQATVLKDQAIKAEIAASDPTKADEAVSLYERYLKYRKTDEDAYHRYAKLMIARAKADPKQAPEAADAVENFLREFPAHPEERLALIDLAIKHGRLASAGQHIKMLFDTPNGPYKTDPDLLDKAAACELGAGGDFLQAVKYRDAAVQTHRARAEVFANLLADLNGNPSFQHPQFTAQTYLRMLLDDEPYESNIECRIVAARFMLLRGEVANARDQVAHALGMPGGSTSPAARIAAAELAVRDIKSQDDVLPQNKKAQQHLEVAVAADPKNVEAGVLLAHTLAVLGDTKRATEVLKRAADALGETNDQFLLVVDELLDLGERDVSSQLIEKIVANPTDEAKLGKYFRGRVAVLKGDWAEARRLLEDAVPTLTRSPQRRKRALVGLGRCYEVLQNPDKQLDCFTRARKDDPAFMPAIIGEAETLYQLGRFAKALPQFHFLVNAARLEQLRPKLAKLELLAALRQPAAARRWTAFEESLGPVEGRTAELEILYAESLVYRGDRDKAAELLTALTAKDPKNVAAWAALTRAHRPVSADPAALAKAEKQALDTLAKAEKQAGDAVEFRLTRAALLTNRSKKPTPDDFRPLTANAAGFDRADQNRLWRGVGDAASRAATLVPEPQAAALRAYTIDCFRAAADLDPHDVVSRAVLIDLGLSAGRSDVVIASLKEIAGIEGENGPIGSLARLAIRLPEVAEIKDESARRAAVRDLRDSALRARSDRPGWGRVYVALAKLDEMEGLTDAALTNYQAAIERGERDEFVVRRAVNLLREKKQDDQAAALLNELRTEMPLPEDLERFRAVKDLLARDVPESEAATIDRVAPADSRDWRVLLLRGSLLAAIHQDDEALKALNNAVFYGDNVPETWGALVAHQVRLGRTDAALSATAQAEERLKTNPPKTKAAEAELVITLALCHELIGNAQQAADRYVKAVSIAPAELNPNRQLVLFLQRTGNTADAEAMLRKLADAPAQDLARWARRHLALTMMVRPDAYFQREAAMQLVERNLKDANPPDKEDEKAKAWVLTVDPRTRDEGVKTLNGFAKWGNLTPDEFSLLGRLYFEQGKVFDAVEYFEKAAKARSGVNAEHIARLAHLYLGTNDLKRAHATVERLKAFSPRGWEAAREEARLFAREAAQAEKEGNPERAKTLTAQALDRVLKFPGARDNEAFVRTKSGPLLEELRFFDEAERLYEQVLAESKDTRTPHVPMALFLINQKRTDRAFALAWDYRDKAPVDVTARLLTGAVRAKRPGADAEKRADEWLDEQVRRSTQTWEQLVLLGSKAELLDARGEYDRAIAAYEQAVERAKALPAEDQKRFLAEMMKNNLSMLLALHRPKDAGRAIELMNEVIAVRGPAPAYLDTRAVAYIVKGGMTDEAVADLKLALLQQQRATYLFHLAWAYHLNPDKQVLHATPLAEAKTLGLTAADLHPLEARKYEELYRDR